MTTAESYKFPEIERAHRIKCELRGLKESAGILRKKVESSAPEDPKGREAIRSITALINQLCNAFDAADTAWYALQSAYNPEGVIIRYDQF
jgi:hypothetical protein